MKLKSLRTRPYGEQGIFTLRRAETREKMKVIPFEPNMRNDETASQSVDDEVTTFLARRRDTILNLEYTRACLGDAGDQPGYAVIFRLIEDALAELRAIDPDDLMDEEQRAALYQRLKSCSRALSRSHYLIRNGTVS